MNSLGKTLSEIRLSNGHKSAKSFFNFLVDSGLECNYQYYMKIEKDQSFPSSVVVNQIAKCLDSNSSQKLILSYCACQFQSFDFLFKETATLVDADQSESKKVQISQGQRELTKREIILLSKRKENYFLFLLLTLSRGPVSFDEISKYSGLSESVSELESCNLVKSDSNWVSSSSSEFRFPVGQDSEVSSAYELFDSWDISFSKQFEFEKLINKTMIRRISPRYLSAIKNQINSISDFVRLSDEAEKKYNNDVLHLQIQLSRGEIPG